MRAVMCTLALSLMLAANAALAEDATTPYLVLDAGGHTAAVSKVRFLPGGTQILTASSDKTIRLWDVQSGECVEVLRPPRGDGSAGVLHALAVSPDGQWVAAAGLERPGFDHGIYLVRLPEHRIVGVLRGHSNAVLDLAFSADSRWLASAAADRTARLWDIAKQQNVATMRGHRDAVYAVAFSPDGRQLATASLDQTARIWSARTGEQTALLRGQKAPLQAIAWRADNPQIATGAVDQSIYFWTPNGQLLNRWEKLGNHVTTVQFIGDLRELFFTLGGPDEKDGGYFFDLATKRERAAWTQHADSVLTGDVSADGRLAATADASGEICVWRPSDGSLVRRFPGAGRRLWSAAWDTQTAAIAWGSMSQYRGPNERGPLEYAFSLKDLDWTDLRLQNVERARTATPAATLEPLNDTTVLARSSAREPMQLKLKSEHDQVRCFTLLDEQTAAIGSDFGLFVFDTSSGRVLRSLSGHTGAVWAVSAAPDNRWLLSAGDDRTLRIWSRQTGQWIMALFFADHEWIAWTPQGYYAASPGGERLMGWQVNRGADQIAGFFPAAQFRKSLYRPDVISRLLDAGGVEEALAAIAQKRGREERLTTVESVLPPVVRITEPAKTTVQVTQPQITIRAQAQPRGPQTVTGLRLLLDGRPYEGRKGIQVVPLDATPPAEIGQEWIVTLTPGTHRVTVLAETAVSQGVSDALEITYCAASVSETRRPDLYVLAVGIADYPGPLRLEFSGKDAHALADTLQTVSKNLFRQVHVRLLMDKDANRRAFMSGLTWLRKEMTQQDVAIVFFSGHGAKDDSGNFFLVPIDADPADLMASAVAGNQLKEALAEIPGRVMVLLDACHAGAAEGDRRKGAYVATDDLVRDLATDDYGVVVMCSSMGREYSRESAENKQGFFTMALIEGLRGKADFNQDGLVYLTELDTYVSDRVKALTLGQQHPVTSKPATIRSFPLSQP